MLDVSLVEETNLPFGQDPAYLGAAHRPFSLRGGGMADLALARDMTLDRLENRADLMRRFDTMRRDLDARHEIAGMDAYARRALEMIASPRTRLAFDLRREPQPLRSLRPHGGRAAIPAGSASGGSRVRVVTLCGGWANDGVPGSASNLTNWDTHEDNFNRLRIKLRARSSLRRPAHRPRPRGMSDEVVVVACGEMGARRASARRTPTATRMLRVATTGTPASP